MQTDSPPADGESVSRAGSEEARLMAEYPPSDERDQPNEDVPKPEIASIIGQEDDTDRPSAAGSADRKNPPLPRGWDPDGP
jgi:hypothetical protein